MSGAPELEAAQPPLVALLERSFPMSARPPLGFPKELWDAALIDPLRQFLRRPGKELRGRLVEVGYALGGGEPGALPEELPLLVELLHAGSLIIDDIEDRSERRRAGPALHSQVGTPLALNAGNWLYFWPFEVLRQLPLTPAQRLSAQDHMLACLARCHEGQALDLHVRVSQLPQSALPSVVATVTRLKTGGLLGLALSLGAIAAGATSEHTRDLHSLGVELGTALQMLDDLSGVVNPARRHKGAEDLRAESPTWVWAWLAQDLDEPSYREHVSALLAVDFQQDATPLLERLAFRLAVTGRSRPRRQQEGALAAYVAGQGDHPKLKELRAMLKRLERSYVEG